MEFSNSVDYCQRQRIGENPISPSRRFCDEFLQDMTYLHCLPPSVEPRVSDHIPQIISGYFHSYRHGVMPYIYLSCVEGDVYFSVEKFPDYGRLSGRRLEDNRAGERVAIDSRKRNPADFALWIGKKRELRIESLAALEKTIRNVLTALGLMPSTYTEALHQLKDKALKRAKLSQSDVQQKIEERDTSRKHKEYEKSDAIRKELAALGITLMDSPEGTTWRPVVPTALQQEPTMAN